MSKEVPGLCALHAIITDNCRKLHGDPGAFDEAMRRIRKQYDLSVAGWSGTTGVKFHLVLTVERPEADKELPPDEDPLAELNGLGGPPDDNVPDKPAGSSSIRS